MVFRSVSPDGDATATKGVGNELLLNAPPGVTDPLANIFERSSWAPIGSQLNSSSSHPGVMKLAELERERAIPAHVCWLKVLSTTAYIHLLNINVEQCDLIKIKYGVSGISARSMFSLESTCFVLTEKCALNESHTSSFLLPKIERPISVFK